MCWPRALFLEFDCWYVKSEYRGESGETPEHGHGYCKESNSLGLVGFIRGELKVIWWHGQEHTLIIFIKDQKQKWSEPTNNLSVTLYIVNEYEYN